jgi:hypothetical protein
MYSEQEYEAFTLQLESAHPKMFANPYGGVAVGSGWWPIIKSLCDEIDHYTKWRNDNRQRLLESNPHNQRIPDQIPGVTVSQIKEKFGGLRFYYDGGDTHIDGMVRMAEVWASHTCEVCGAPGRSRSGGWIRTLCDEHEEQRQQRMKQG